MQFFVPQWVDAEADNYLFMKTFMSINSDIKYIDFLSIWYTYW